MNAPTPGPYERDGVTVYALQHSGWRKGEEQFCNRIYASVQRGVGCPEEEAEAVAALFQAAPELMALLDEVYFDLIQGAMPNEGDPWFEKTRAALAKARGQS